MYTYLILQSTFFYFDKQVEYISLKNICVHFVNTCQKYKYTLVIKMKENLRENKLLTYRTIEFIFIFFLQSLDVFY